MTSNLSRLDTLVVKPGHEKQEEQKREETFYVCLMLNKLGVSMGNQLEPIWDEPAPDFYLEYDGQLVGLEVTEAHPKDADGRPLYFQVLRYRAVYGAWKRFRERGGPTLQVRFRFKEGIPTSGPFTQEDVRNLIGQLEHLIDVSGFDPEGGYQRFRMRSEVPDVSATPYGPATPPKNFGASVDLRRALTWITITSRRDWTTSGLSACPRRYGSWSTTQASRGGYPAESARQRVSRHIDLRLTEHSGWI